MVVGGEGESEGNHHEKGEGEEGDAHVDQEDEDHGEPGHVK